MSLLSDLNDKIKRLSIRVAEEFKAQQSAIDSKVSTVNGMVPDENGNVEVSADTVVGHNVGDIWTGYDPASVPTDVQLYEGQLLSRSDYETHSALVFGGKRTVISEADWQAYVTEYGFCPWFSDGDGATTYRFPLIQDVHPEFVASLEDAGKFIAAGLPDHAHTLTQTGTFHSASSGADTVYTVAMSQHMQSVNAGRSLIDPASKNNTIYGASDTVQPPSLTFLIGEYIKSTSVIVDEIDEETILADIDAIKTSYVKKSGDTMTGDLTTPSLHLAADGKLYFGDTAAFWIA